MTKKQWIWLVAALVIFALIGTWSVAVNTWSKKTAADTFTGVLESLSSASEAGAYGFPDDDFIARVDIVGTIMEDSTAGLLSAAAGFSYDDTIDYIDALIDCESNTGILLYVDSGGGEVKASDDIYLKLMDYKNRTGRPIWAYFSGTACSGAYYIAMAADSIWANRNCMCVNIGVYIQTYNLSGLFEKYGIEEVMIKSSANKGIGSVGQPWTEEQLAIYQSIVDLYYAQFVDVVAQGRGMTADQVKALDDGREMLSPQALQAGFIDGICRYEEYAGWLEEHIGVPVWEREETQMDLFSQLLSDIYGRLETLAPRSDAQVLRDYADRQNGIVVMAYAG